MKKRFSDLFEFGGTEDNDGRTVYYDPNTGQTFVGETVYMLQIFSSTGSSVFAVYVFNRILKIEGILPLAIGTIIILLLTIWIFKSRKNKIVEVEPFIVTETYIHQQKVRIIFSIFFTIIWFAITTWLALAYLKHSGLLFFILTIAALHACFAIIGLRPDKRYKVLKQLEKDFKENKYD